MRSAGIAACAGCKRASVPKVTGKVGRQMTASSSENTRIIEKIPFFQGLSPRQVQAVLHAGQVAKHAKGEVLCRKGDKSTEIFILLSGELSIRNGDVELARVKPVEIVGEMGAVTGQPRCATVEVAEHAALIVIGKIKFDVLLKNDVEMAAKVYKTMLDSLSQKLRENNIQLVNLRSASRGMVASAV